MSTTTISITPLQLKQFREEGYFILERAIPDDQLEQLRAECGRFINDIDTEWKKQAEQLAGAANATEKESQEDKELLEACKEIARYKVPFRLEDVQLVRPGTTEEEITRLPRIVRLNRGLYKLSNAIGISHPGKRYFIAFKFLESPVLQSFLFGPTMQTICRDTIGDDARLFLEQFVVKGPEVGMKFGWHQDSGYVPYEHDPYVTCWCALDDMSEKNGTIYVTPFSKDPESKKGVLPHRKEGGTNDMMCYGPEVPLTFGIPIIVPAGSIVVFSSLTPHSSGANTTNQMRRAYIVQYSAHPIEARYEKLKGLTGPRHFDDPVIHRENDATK